jgi:tripartite-type tricarboxylate transporter receptor subunit TctC
MRCAYCTAALLALSSASVAAADYPSRPVRAIVGFPAGSGVDIVARLVGQKLSEQYGQQFVVDNRPGAGSNIGTQLAAKAPADGYTLFLGTVANAINATLYRELPFDFMRDFAPIVLAGSAPNLLVVHPSLPARSVAELVKLARAKPGHLSFGSSGTGTAPHLAGELFKSMAAIDVTHIPYKGGPQATTDLIAGQYDYLFAISSTVLPHIRSGRLRALAITTAARAPSMPDLPSVAETLPGFEAVTWFGYMTPAGTPQDIVARLNADITKVLARADVREPLATQGIEVKTSSPEQFGAYVRDEITKWARAVKASGARAE